MKHFFVVLALALLTAEATGQPEILWQKNFGGNAVEAANSAQETTDGGYIIAGYTSSENNGNVADVPGNGDFWILKISFEGEIEWQKALGGSSSESAYSIKQTDDGGYIIAGSTYSNDGDVSGNHGDKDVWVVKTDAFGMLQWQKALGGSKTDEARAIQETADGGFIVVGYTASNDGDVTGNHGYYDIWVIKLSNAGAIQWQKTLGGNTGADWGYDIQLTNDGGYILVGETGSNDGDVTGYHGSIDFWVVKLNMNGQIEWQKALGGSGLDSARSICQAIDGGYVVVGVTGSGNNGDVSGVHGGFDFWVVKLSANGTIKWQKTLGGSDSDWGETIQQSADGGYFIAGTTHSEDLDVLNNDGIQDFWILKLNAFGTIQWQKTLGGTQAEVLNYFLQTSDDGFIAIGDTYSDDGDVSSNYGESDFWIVKLAPESTPTTEASNIAPLEIYPNTAHNTITLQTAAHEPDLQITITDMLGRTIQRQSIQNDKTVDVSTLASGMYIITATAPSGKTYSGTFKKE